MRITTFKHTCVKPNGEFCHTDEPGAVYTHGRISISAPKGGCGLKGCNCSPGHWINAVLPRTESGVVRGMTIYFDSRDEMLAYLGVNKV